MYFLDTNTCIYFLNGKFEKLKAKVLGTSPAQIKIPSVVKAELLFGAYKSKLRDSNLEKLEAFLQPFEVVSFGEQDSYQYASIRHLAEVSGKVVGPNDLLIASTVLLHRGILVTNNSKEFSAISGLVLENWAE